MIFLSESLPAEIMTITQPSPNNYNQHILHTIPPDASLEAHTLTKRQAQGQNEVQFSDQTLGLKPGQQPEEIAATDKPVISLNIRKGRRPS